MLACYGGANLLFMWRTVLHSAVDVHRCMCHACDACALLVHTCAKWLVSFFNPDVTLYNPAPLWCLVIQLLRGLLEHLPVKVDCSCVDFDCLSTYIKVRVCTQF